MSKFIAPTLVLLVAFLSCALAVEGFTKNLPPPRAAAVSAVTEVSHWHVHKQELSDRQGIDWIVTVLESRIGNRRLPLQAKERLAFMDEQDFRLIARLCSRIDTGGDTAGTDIALLLATALIILS